MEVDRKRCLAAVALALTIEDEEDLRVSWLASRFLGTRSLMASEDVHCVSGFCRGFDWRSTVFQEPVPSFRICSLCGVIPKTVVQLRCTYSLCESCYARCLDHESICLVDKTPVERDRAERLSLSLNQLDEFKVLCWNAPEGCKFVGSLTGLLEHFQEQCEFHVVCCPTCDKKVLRQDIVPHIKGGNHADFLFDSSASNRTISPLRNVENTCAEIRLQLGKISDDLRNFQRQLGHLSIDPEKPANGCTKNLEGEISKTIQLLYEIKNILLKTPEESTSSPCIFRGPTSEFFRASNTLFAAIAEVSRSARYSGRVTVHWYLEHWTDLKKHARDEGLVLSESHVQLTKRKIPAPLISLASRRLLPPPGSPTSGQRLNDQTATPTRSLVSMAHDKAAVVPFEANSKLGERFATTVSATATVPATPAAILSAGRVSHFRPNFRRHDPRLYHRAYRLRHHNRL
ncbi:hypothetical protein HPB47_002017 [Ixodes persulcatus]|uniref:Uncharacterized protein n=1 Tax=Ixodes persulcatus TaxID=34615 RepID=A0AC60PMN5_IXOPE|nr:hypothetical protein HPB47_002017 [Ixodes persulcatus]